MASALLHASSDDTTAATHQTPRKPPTRPVYFCPIPGCSKTFRRRFSLKEHVAGHTGEKAFVCSVGSCGRSFSTSGNLARHKRAQHPWLDVPLECLVDDCGCTFASERKLERHMAMVHFSGSSHTCQVRHCGCAFTTAGNLRRHMKQQHKDVDTKAATEDTTVHSPTAIDCVELELAEPHWFVPVAPLDAELMDVLSCLFD